MSDSNRSPRTRNTADGGARATLAPTFEDRLIVLLAAGNLVLLVGLAPTYGQHGLHIAWSTSGRMFAAQAGFAVAWLYFRRYRTHPTKRALVDVIAAVQLLVAVTAILAPAQYVAVALRRPLIDPYLAAADAAMGINVADFARWTARHTGVSLALALSYASLLPQAFLPPVVLGLVSRNREHLWEYVFHYHFCLVVTLACLALFPAACAFQYYGVPSAFDQSRFVAHFAALRAGTFGTISLTDLEGLISMPSFHVACGLMVTWSFRRHPAVLVPIAVLNVMMIAATFLSGAHYVIDVVASAALFGVSVAAYSCLVRVTERERSAAPAECGLPIAT